MSLLSGLIGGAANSVYDIYDKKIDAEQRATDRKAEMDYQNELALKREETVRKIKEREEEALRQRVIGEYDAAEKGGLAIADERDQGLLKKYAGTLQQGEKSGDFSEEEKETIRNMPEAARKIYEKSGALKERNAITETDDMISAARKQGANSSVLEALNKQRAAVVADMKERFRQALEERKQAALEQDRKTDNERLERVANATIAASNRRGADGGSKDDDKIDPKLKAAYDVAQKNKPEPPKLSTSSAKKDYEAKVQEWKTKYGSVIDRYESALGIGAVATDTPKAPPPAGKRPPLESFQRK